MVWVPSNQLSCSLGAKKGCCCFLFIERMGTHETTRGSISMIHTKKTSRILCFTFQLPKCWKGHPQRCPQWSSTFGSTLQGWEAQQLCQLLAVWEVRMLPHHHQKWHAICMVLRLLRQTKKSHIQRNLSFPESHFCYPCCSTWSTIHNCI